MNFKWLIGLFLSCLLASMSAVSAKPASKQSIEILMERTGAGDMGIQMMNQMIPALKKAIPKAPDKFWADIMADMNANQIIELVIPVYQKHLTEEDVKKINAFYNTTAGKKLIKAQPAIMQESFEIGQMWGQKIAKEIIEKYKTQSANKS